MSIAELYAHLQQQQHAQQLAHVSGQRGALHAALAALQTDAPAAVQAPADTPIAPELSAVVEQLAAALLSPPEELFADLSGAPQAPVGAFHLVWRVLCTLWPFVWLHKRPPLSSRDLEPESLYVMLLQQVIKRMCSLSGSCGMLHIS